MLQRNYIILPLFVEYAAYRRKFQIKVTDVNKLSRKALLSVILRRYVHGIWSVLKIFIQINDVMKSAQEYSL
jgi:hypothetical protein